MPGPWGSYLGFGNIGGNTNYGSQAERDLAGLWGQGPAGYSNDPWLSFLAPYLQQFAGTPFANRLRGAETEIRNMWEAENARRRAATGGDPLSAVRPDDWLQGLMNPGVRGRIGGLPGGGTGEWVGAPERSGFDPMSWYMSQSPQARGEGRMPNPFTRWLQF